MKFAKHPRLARAFAGAIPVVLLGLLAYPLSFGPACWMADRNILPPLVIAKIFAPLLDAPVEGSYFRDSTPLTWWADLGARRVGVARRLWCSKTAEDFGCGTISGCNYDDFDNCF